MTSTLDDALGGDCVRPETLRADGAFTAVNYHFGMLLGVDDFETEQGYHRGKRRLHNGWLHGGGVVWGLEVTVDRPSGEVRVEPGLALDRAGRELYLPVRACLSLPRWFAEHADDPALRAVREAGDAVRFPAHVELRHCSCFGRQVPALADPCEGADRDTAYSRLHETVDIRLVPGPATDVPCTHRLLRILFGLEAPGADPGDRAARDARAAVLAAGADDRAPTLLAAFRRLAAQDSLAWAPPEVPDGEPPATLPALEDDALTIAALPRVALEQAGEGGYRVGDTPVEMGGRATLVPTAAIQELLCGLFPGGDGAGAGAAAGGGPVGQPVPADAGGPRAKPETFARGGTRVAFEVDRRLREATVDRNAFRVSVLADTGWEPIGVTSADVSDDGLTVTLQLRRDPGDTTLRLIARGTGQTPLLGDDGIPLAGGPDSPPGTEHDGHDFVVMDQP